MLETEVKFSQKIMFCMAGLVTFKIVSLRKQKKTFLVKFIIIIIIFHRKKQKKYGL